MITNNTSIEEISTSVNTVWNETFAQVPTAWKRFCTETKFTGSKMLMSWVKDFKSFAPWINSRNINEIELDGYAVESQSYELTYGIKRSDLNDTQAVAQMADYVKKTAVAAARLPAELLRNLIDNGETGLCYDGTPFFGTAHPGVDANGDARTQANLIAGTETAWYLFKLDHFAIKPFGAGERLGEEMKVEVHESGDLSFMQNKILLGGSARRGSAYGFWQFAFKSKEAFTAANFEKAYDAMCSLKGDDDLELDCAPDVLVAPRSMRASIEAVIGKAYLGKDGDNPNYKRVEVVYIETI